MRMGKLLAWFRKGARDLPWRRTRDPYAIWVSEVMLQQTQVATVIPYYERFLRRFPTVEALARARLDEVLKIWEGLGYYARARNLHRAARSLKSLPRTSREWLEVPGVGAYTAAAIASIAYGEPVAVFDGNVRRVLSRLRGRDVLSAPPPRGNPGDSNQALMELGQRICTPRQPKCAECPLSSDCAGRASGEPEQWPTKKAKKTVPHREVAVGVIWKGDQVYVQRRPEGGLLGGLWEFPGGKREQGETYEEALRREIREETGFLIDVGPYLTTVRHRYSHFSVELHAYHCFHRKGRAGGRWVSVEGIEKLAMPAANLRILDSLRRSGPPLPLVVSAGRSG
jgi:A/G-specific adenine glycosylase